MEKLSGILPSNARIKAVDLRESHPVRPGVPNFGIPQGRNSVVDRVSLSSGTKEQALQDTLVYKNPREASRAKIVSDLSKQFFQTKIKEYDKPATLSEDVMDLGMAELELAPVDESTENLNKELIKE